MKNVYHFALYLLIGMAVFFAAVCIILPNQPAPATEPGFDAALMATLCLLLTARLSAWRQLLRRWVLRLLQRRLPDATASEHELMTKFILTPSGEKTINSGWQATKANCFNYISVALFFLLMIASATPLHAQSAVEYASYLTGGGGYGNDDENLALFNDATGFYYVGLMDQGLADHPRSLPDYIWWR
jgi:hypothetical protein